MKMFLISQQVFHLKIRKFVLCAAFATGLCYGKLEAGILTFIIPTVLLGHLV